MEILHQYQKNHQIISNDVQLRYAYGEVEGHSIFDRENNHYLLILITEDRSKMVQVYLVHLEVINDKIWIHREGTEDGIVGDFFGTGIPKEMIALGFYPPETRKLLILRFTSG
ncbi:MAG: element excision factor XisI family protein [Cyanobacteria bacterium P01_G01_bin.54]